MRHPQLASVIWHLGQGSLSALGSLACSGEGWKCHNKRTGKCFIYRTTTYGYIHLISSCSKSCCNTANLERAHFYWHEQVWPLLTTQHYWDIAPYIMSVGLVHESKQKPVWTWMLVAEERVASPRTAQRVSVWEKGLWRVFLLTTVQVCTYARRKPFTRYKLKATFIAANWEQLSGGNTKKRSEVRHWEARISLIIMYLLVSNVSCTWNLH